MTDALYTAFEHADPVLQHALDCSRLSRKPEGLSFSQTEAACARVMLDEWLVGGRSILAASASNPVGHTEEGRKPSFLAGIVLAREPVG